jgi:hypothetical protein
MDINPGTLDVSVSTEGTIKLQNITAAYAYRPVAFKHYSLYVFVATVRLMPFPKHPKQVNKMESEQFSETEEETKADNKRGRDENATFLFPAGCTWAETHMLRLKSKQEIPKIFKPPSLPKSAECPTPAREKKKWEKAHHIFAM